MKSSILHDSKDPTFQNKQNYRDNKKIGGCQGLEGREGRIGGVQGTFRAGKLLRLL